MLNERKFTDQQTNRDERAIDSLLKQAQLSSHSGDGTSKFSQMARDRAALLRKTQKHLKKSKRLRDSVEYEEEVINEEDPHVSSDPRHPANQRSSDQSGSGRTYPYVHTNPHTGEKVRTRLGGATHIHPKTGASERTDGVFDPNTRGIPSQKPVTDRERERLKAANEGVSDTIEGAYDIATKVTDKFNKVLDKAMKPVEDRAEKKFNKPAKTTLGKLGQKLFNSVEYPIEAGESNEGYGPGPSYGKKGLRGFRRFEDKPGKVNELNTSTLKSYISKAQKDNTERVVQLTDKPSHMKADKGEMQKLRKRQKGVVKAKDIIKQRASDAALDWENSDDGMDSRVIGT